LSKIAPTDSEFLVTDPDQQPDVVLEVPAGITPLGLSEEGYYSDKMVRCSFCKQRQKHRKGFFAILPDGKKALCGHCCAVQLTSKETVAKIERGIDRKVKAAKQQQVSTALLEDVEELTQILKSDLIPVEAAIERNLEELNDVFTNLNLSHEYKLGYALGGFRSISNACEDRISDAKVEELLKKRKLSMQAVGKALDAMEQATSMLQVSRLGGRINNWAKPNGYERSDVSFKNGVLVAGKWQTHLGEYDFWETTVEIERVVMPSCGRVREIIAPHCDPSSE
jgi:hypothetical protein